MAHWSECAVTNEGAAMLNEWMAGRTITLSSVYGGTGLVEKDSLTGQTGLLNRRQTLSLLGQTDGEGGKNVQIQVSNKGLEEEYVLNQIGVYAKLDAGRDSETEERLLFIMQDRQGVTIPPEAEESFLLELYCVVGVTNNGRFKVQVDALGIVTMGYLRETLERLMSGHNESPEAHPPLWERLGRLDARLSLLELMYGTDVRGNPFTVTFGDLAELEVRGVWNAAQQRLEF